MKRHLFVLLACLFVVMIGFGITLPVRPFYVERLALKDGAPRQSIVLQHELSEAFSPPRRYQRRRRMWSI